MDPARPLHSSLTYNVLVVALVAMIGAGAALLFMTTGSPRAGARSELGTGEAGRLSVRQRLSRSATGST